MIDFNDTETAFTIKSDRQLKKAYWLFKLVANRSLVSFGKGVSSLAVKLGLPIKGIVKSTVYDQFVGGETIKECGAIIDTLEKHKVYCILDYSIEGKETEEAFDHTRDKTIETIEYGKNKGGIPFAVFKVTGVARFGLLEKISGKKSLSEKEQVEWGKAQGRVESICQKAFDHQLPVLIDAEESWIQEAIDQLAEGMMEKYNLQNPIVYNTLQMYRHDRLEYLKELHRKATQSSYNCAVKLVRGAYMEKERERAEKLGYPSPIQKHKDATDHDYDLALEYVCQNLNDISLVAGTHNEVSSKRLAELMDEHNIAKGDSRIWFSQLYGMSENLSFNLAKAGYNVVKYLPFGPVKETLPYLIRRAEENTSAAGQTNRELLLIQKEILRRGI